MNRFKKINQFLSGEPVSEEPETHEEHDDLLKEEIRKKLSAPQKYQGPKRYEGGGVRG